MVPVAFGNLGLLGLKDVNAIYIFVRKQQTVARVTRRRLRRQGNDCRGMECNNARLKPMRVLRLWFVVAVVCH